MGSFPLRPTYAQAASIHHHVAPAYRQRTVAAYESREKRARARMALLCNPQRSTRRPARFFQDYGGGYADKEAQNLVSSGSSKSDSEKWRPIRRRSRKNSRAAWRRDATPMGGAAYADEMIAHLRRVNPTLEFEFVRPEDRDRERSRFKDEEMRPEEDVA